MLKPLLLFALVRSVMASAIGLVVPMHDGRPFGAAFSDLALYNGAGSNTLPLWSLPNPLFAALVRGLCYTQ